MRIPPGWHIDPTTSIKISMAAMAISVFIITILSLLEAMGIIE